MSEAAVQTFKKKVTITRYHTETAIKEAYAMIGLVDEDVSFNSFFTKMEDLTALKRRLASYQVEADSVLSGDNELTTAETKEQQESMKSHLDWIPKLTKEVDDATTALCQRLVASDAVTSPCWSDGTASGDRTSGRDKNAKPTRRSRSLSPTNLQRYAHIPHEQRGQGTQNGRQQSKYTHAAFSRFFQGSNGAQQGFYGRPQRNNGPKSGFPRFQQGPEQRQQRDSTQHPTTEWVIQYVKEALRQERQSMEQKLDQLVLLLGSGSNDACCARYAHASSGTGCSSSERNPPIGGKQMLFSQAPSQPDGSQQSFHGSPNGNNHGSAHNYPSAMFQPQGTPEEELDRRIRYEQIKSSNVASALKILKAFSGEACDYLSFMAQFNFLVHNNAMIDARAKQSILVSLLPSALAQRHQTTEVSEEKYHTIRNNLERQFNNQVLEMMRAIGAATFPEDLTKLRSALNTFVTTADKLQLCGINPNDPFFLIQMIGKLPEEVRRVAYKEIQKENPSLRELMVEIHEAITMQQGFRATASTSALADDESHVNKVSVNAVAHQRQQQYSAGSSGGKPRKEFVPPSKETPCRYCNNKTHAAVKCNAPYKQKTQAVKTKNLCRNCLSEKHTTLECESRHDCANCDRRHFTGNCPQLKDETDFSRIFPDLGLELEDDKALEHQLFRGQGAQTPEH